MKLNNRIGSPTSSTGWTSFTTSIGGTVSNPTTGTVQANQSSYLQMGNVLYLKYYFYQTTAGTAGGGGYRFNIPPGFTMNTAIISAANLPVLGSATLQASGTFGIGMPYYANSTQYEIMAYAAGTTSIQTVGSAWFSLANSSSYSVSLEIPII